jgi:2-methylcitrate dehydratase PrpD
MSENITAEVSRFVSTTQLADVPQDVIEAAKRSILDGFGLAVAGSRTTVASLAENQVTSYGLTAAEATVLGRGVKAPARFAAFLNGLAIHADDYDDTQLAVAADRVYGLLTHPTAPALPPALALAERERRSGAEVLIGYLVGVEVETKVAEAISPRHYDDGFHSTGTAGTIGAGAAAARLLGLDAERTAIAIGIAASESSGLRENFGTMTKPLHAGRAAEGGVFAAELARAGFTATDHVLEARRGFFRAAGGGFDEAAIAGRLGSPWTFASPGVSIKPHPSGSLTHPAMTAMLGLIREHHLDAAAVEEVYVGTNRHMPNALIYSEPETDLEAKFSMQFCMAILLLDGRAGLAQFTDETVAREDVRDLVRRVRFEIDPEAEAAGYNNMTSIVRVRLRDGRTVEARAAFAKGSPQNPMSDAELLEKFLDCTRAGNVADDRARLAAEKLLELERLNSVAEVVRLLAGAPQQVSPHA